MPKYTTNVLGDFKGSNVKVNQGIPFVAKGLVKEMAIPAHKGRTPQSSQQCDDLVVLQSLATHITPDLIQVNAPTA
jgi:hypothetical protein